MVAESLAESSEVKLLPEPSSSTVEAISTSPSSDNVHDDLREDTTIGVGHKVTMVMAVILPFVGFIAAIVSSWYVGWMGWFYVGMLVAGWILTGMGITVGFHRLLTHRSFDTFTWVRAFWMAMGSLAVQGSPIVWCAVHRKHHEMSDKPGDPHSPHLHGEGLWNSLKGFFHSHTGWLLAPHWVKKDNLRYVPDLMKEPMLVWVDRLYYLWVPASLLIPALIAGAVTMSWKGALLGFIWGGLARVFVVHHITWSINSICHIFGRREYESHDESRNNLICGILGHGEGWHNTHHAFPTSARHGLEWWQFDSSWLVIRGMELLGLAWNVRLPGEKALEAKRIKSHA
jgi:stearoyl-CoA desaturase (delta-9 desaturase)